MPPHLGPDDVQHYCNLRLVCKAWKAKMDGECGRRRKRFPFGLNTIPLLRMVTERWMAGPVEACVHTYFFGNGVHHPTSPAINKHHRSARPLISPLYADYIKGERFGSWYQRGPHGLLLPTSSWFWYQELAAVGWLQQVIEEEGELDIIIEVDEQ